MKPLEFKIEKAQAVNGYIIVFYYEDGTQQVVPISNTNVDLFEYIGLEKRTETESRHYSIADIYGYKVVDDRKGL